MREAHDAPDIGSGQFPKQSRHHASRLLAVDHPGSQHVTDDRGRVMLNACKPHEQTTRVTIPQRVPTYDDDNDGDGDDDDDGEGTSGSSDGDEDNGTANGATNFANEEGGVEDR